MKERLASQEVEKRFTDLNVVVVGLPGSGKSTLIDSFSVKPNYITLGGITLETLKEGGALSDKIREKFETTSPWPAEFVMEILSPHILKAKENDSGFVLDGVPRKTSEAILLTQWLRKSEISVDLLLHLFVDTDMALKRISLRNCTGRLESQEHYQNRMKVYLAEERDILSIMQGNSMRSLTINTNVCTPESVKDQLIEFVAAKF